MKINISPYVFPGVDQSLLPKVDKRYDRYKITPEEVLSIVAEFHGLSPESIIEKNKCREITDARHMYCGILKNRFKYSYKDIAKILKRDDERTIYHSIKIFKGFIQFEPVYRDQYNKILEHINSKIN